MSEYEFFNQKVDERKAAVIKTQRKTSLLLLIRIFVPVVIALVLLAILEKRVGLKMFQKDVFLNFAGGFKVSDTGLDLAVVAAVLSSYFDRPINEGVALAGEIGLSGEVRPAPRTEQRISEAARLGFKKIVVSGYAALPSKKVKGIEVARINTVGELARHLFSGAVE